MRTHEANAIAIKGRAKAIREALRKLGMQRCSLRLVYRQAEAPDGRFSWYELFWRWFHALWTANRPGAEFLFEDFRSRVLALRDEDDLSQADWTTEAVRCSDEHADAIREAFLNSDTAAIKKEVSEAITAYRRLLGIVEAREGSLDGGGQCVERAGTARAA
jgi:hypothetical protein